MVAAPAAPKPSIDNAERDLSGVEWRSAGEVAEDGSFVEVAKLDHGFRAVRNGQYPTGPALIYTPAEWEAFVLGVKDGEFD